TTLERGEISLELPDKGALIQGEAELRKTHPPVAPGHPVEARPAQQARQLASTDARPAIPLLRQCQEGIRSNPDRAVHPPGEVHDKDWKGRVGDRIDQSTNRADSLRSTAHDVTPDC